MHQKFLYYLACDDILAFNSWLNMHPYAYKHIQTLSFRLELEGGYVVSLDFYQYCALNGSPDFNMALFNREENKLEYARSLNQYIISNLDNELQKAICEKIFNTYAKICGTHSLTYYFLSDYFCSIANGPKNKKLSNLVHLIKTSSEANILVSEFNEQLDFFFEDRKPDFTVQAVSNFIATTFDLLDAKQIISHSLFSNKLLEAFRQQLWNNFLSGAKKREIAEQFIIEADIDDIMHLQVIEFLVSQADFTEENRKDVARKLVPLLTDDLTDYTLYGEHIGNFAKIMKLLYPSQSECKDFLKVLKKYFSTAFITTYNPEIFTLFEEHFSSVEQADSVVKEFREIVELRYPVIILEEPTRATEVVSETPRKKRKRVEEQSQQAVDLVASNKRVKLSLESKSKQIIRADFLEYYAAERAFANATNLDFKVQSSDNILGLKLEIISYIHNSLKLGEEENPGRFFYYLQLHKSLKDIFVMLMEYPLQVFHFSEVKISDSILSNDKLNARGVHKSGFTNEDDKKTGNTGYVFACTSYTFDGVASSLNIHSFLNEDTSFLYKTYLSSINAMPFAILTMQDWAMYNETLLYTAALSESVKTKMWFCKNNKPNFIRNKIIEVTENGEQRCIEIPREKEIFYGREIPLGLALSTISILTKLGDEVISNLHSNLSITNLANFIATYMPLEIKIPNEISMQICKTITRTRERWSDLAVTPFNQ